MHGESISTSKIVRCVTIVSRNGLEISGVDFRCAEKRAYALSKTRSRCSSEHRGHNTLPSCIIFCASSALVTPSSEYCVRRALEWVVIAMVYCLYVGSWTVVGVAVNSGTPSSERPRKRSLKYSLRSYVFSEMDKVNTSNEAYRAS